MQPYIIALIMGILVYLIIRILMPISEEEIVKERVFKYFAKSSIDDVAEQVRKERYENSHKKAELNERLISRDFADYIISSGVKLTPSEFLYAWIGSTLIPVILFAILGLSIVTLIAAGIIGFAAPPLLLGRTKKKKQELFTAQLGEAVIIMGNAIKGGFSFIQALESIAAEMQPPIAAEFGKCIREIQYGITQEEALRNMAEKNKNEDLNLLVSAVLTSAQVGGNLSDILDTISLTIKDRIRIKQEVRVLTSTGRMSAIIIGLLPVFIVLILMFLNPDYFGLFFETSLGKIMVVVSLILEITGFMVIRKISDIQY
jgi:tight adherence protein B